jgi:hypothetical protein
MGLDTALSVNFDANGRAEGSQGEAKLTLHNCQRLADGRRTCGISRCPDRERRNASRGRGSEPCETIDHSVGNGAERLYRMAHPDATHPGRAAVPVFPLHCSSRPRWNKRTRCAAVVESCCAGSTMVALQDTYVERLRAYPCFASLVCRAGVVQWQYRSFPSFGRGFDSHRPLHKSR